MEISRDIAMDVEVHDGDVFVTPQKFFSALDFYGL
jgi:hypothetical protein